MELEIWRWVVEPSTGDLAFVSTWSIDAKRLVPSVSFVIVDLGSLMVEAKVDVDGDRVDGWPLGLRGRDGGILFRLPSREEEMVVFSPEGQEAGQPSCRAVQCS